MSNRTLPRLLQTPAVILLLFWMLVPLSMTLYFSFIRYVLNSSSRPEWMSPSLSNWRGFGNYQYVMEAKDFWFAIQNSVFIVEQYSVNHGGSWPWYCGSGQQVVSGTRDRSGSTDLTVLRDASCERVYCGST